MVEKLKRLVIEEEGQGMVEYSLITALIAAIAIFVFATDTGLKDAISGVFTSIKDRLNGVSL